MFLATLVALHFTPVSESVSGSAEFRTSVAPRLASLLDSGSFLFYDLCSMFWQRIFWDKMNNVDFALSPKLVTMACFSNCIVCLVLAFVCLLRELPWVALVNAHVVVIWSDYCSGGLSENFKKLSQQTSKCNNYTATNEWKLQSCFPSHLLSPHHPCYLLLSPSSNEFLQGTCSSSLPPHLGTRAISISPSASISTWISFPDTISNPQNCERNAVFDKQ